MRRAKTPDAGDGRIGLLATLSPEKSETVVAIVIAEPATTWYLARIKEVATHRFLC